MSRPKAAASQDLVEQICSQTMPCQKLSPENFWRLCAAYPHREAASVYLYRRWPIIDRRLAGIRYNNIDKFAVDDKTIDEERILAQHGSGVYRITFNDANRPRPLRQVADTSLTMDRADRPPVVPIQELVVEHPDNRSYIQALRAAGELKDNSMSSDSKAVDQLASANQQLMQQVLRGRGASADAMDLALKLVELLKPKQDAFELAIQIQKMMDGRRDDGILKTLLDNQAELTKAVLARGGKEGGELEALERVLGIAEKAGLVPRGGGARSHWTESLKSVLAHVATIMLGLPAVIASLRANARPGPSAPVISVPAELPAAPPQSTVADAAEDEGAEEESQMSAPNFQALMIVGQRGLEAYRAGKSGAEFGAALQMVEPDLYQQLRSLGKAGIMQAVSAAPGLMEQLAEEREKLESWLDSFFA